LKPLTLVINLGLTRVSLIKRIKIKSKRLKNKKEMKMKCFCNLIAYSKNIKKITIKRTMIKCEGKINCKG
jgi:hypothetical protein